MRHRAPVRGWRLAYDKHLRFPQPQGEAPSFVRRTGASSPSMIPRQEGGMNKHVRHGETQQHTSLPWSAELDPGGHRSRRRAPPVAWREGSPTAREAFVSSLLASIATSRRIETPYRHWALRRCLPKEAVDSILALPFPAPDLGGVSGRRELHNATRTYFDVENRRRFP